MEPDIEMADDYTSVYIMTVHKSKGLEYDTVIMPAMNGSLINCLGLTVYSVMGCGRQKGHISKAENDDVETNLLPKIYVMTVVKDSELKLIMNDIYNEIGTGTHGDGKVFVSNIEDAMRIRTGECGENAL